MRQALSKQWTNFSLTRPLQSTPSLHRSYLHESRQEQITATISNGASDSVQAFQNEQEQSASKPSARPASLASELPNSRLPIRKQLFLRRSNFLIGPKSCDGQASVLAESLGKDRQASQGSLSLTKDQWDQESWSRLLDSVRTYRRHSKSLEAWTLYLNVMQNRLDMPTEGKEAVELWEHFIQLGSNQSKTSSMVAEYAIELQNRTGTARSDGLYRSIIGNQLWRYPYQALKLHRLLKCHFPPDLEDYKTLFRLSLHAGGNSFKVFRNIYRDHPVLDLYSTVVPELCKQDMRTEATNWHFLLVERGDLPQNFHDSKPLFLHYSHLMDDKVVEALAKSLIQKQLWYEKDVENFVQEDKFISREIMNRALGEAHKIAPKRLSDNFCARLFATKFFSVAMVVSGLQIMGLESIGPSALREMVVRDGYHCETVMGHIQILRENGISLKQCKYNTVIEKAASGEKAEVLKSMASTDLHPDTFEDIDMQERLLAMYCKAEDRVQTERTLEVFRSSTPDRSWGTYRANLLLRCHISLRDRPQVISILEYMQLNRYPLAPRSSRHLRTTFLPPRRAGEQPSNSRQALEDITLVINVMKMSLQSNCPIPIEAWKEILKRLGMMGHLDRYQGLALWLVGWYSRPIEPEASHRFASSSMHAVRPVSANRISSKSVDPLELMDRDRPIISRGNAQIQNRDLLQLFGKDAQQAMIAWGFQVEIKKNPNVFGKNTTHYIDPRTHWQWGLRLLKTLQLRGVQVNKPAVARACQLRLMQLFGVTTTSKNLINRRAKALNDERSKLMADFRYGAYVKGIEEIWGRDLLNHFILPAKEETNVIRGRLVRYTKMRRQKRETMLQTQAVG